MVKPNSKSLWLVALCPLLFVTVSGGVLEAQSTTNQTVKDQHSEALSLESGQAIVDRTCRRCHNDRRLQGNLSLESFKVAEAGNQIATTEKMIRKLRAGMMPPPGGRRPDGATLNGLAELLESRTGAAAKHSPGRSFQRLNRAEYERSIKDLLALDIDAGEYLPLDTKSANFDNIADAQPLSATLMQGYLGAASEISRVAIGNPSAAASESTYKVSRWVSQREHSNNTPYGTRGGIAIEHNFPADGEYVFRVSFHHETTGALHGSGRAALHTAEAPEQLEISVDGERVALLSIDRWMHASDPNGVNIWTDPIQISGGKNRISASFIQRFDGPVQDIISPHDWSLASTAVANAYGVTSLPHLRDLAIRGPYNPSKVSGETPSRQKIFVCYPDASTVLPCAEEIISKLGTQAYRRPLTDEDIKPLISLYETGATQGGFESGIQMAVEGILASPHFVFRLEEPPASTYSGTVYPVNDLDLASRLSFFLWASGPDEALINLASQGQLSNPETLKQQVHRMLTDTRSEALATRFASQWLRLQDLENIHPTVRIYPNFDAQLKSAMLRETQLLFESLVREDRSVLDLLRADYTFVNERLAKHYGLPNIAGPDFRRIEYPDESRRGLLGHGSVLTMTSHADRTSPVLRGKWVMEVLLGSPPPPPPPDIPDLEATAEAKGGRFLSVRERMEEHRANPSCNSCHRVIDPIGLALENFDVTGAWRIKDNGVTVDSTGELYDGTSLVGPKDLQQALLRRQTTVLRTFTENLMAYALGRRVGYDDMVTVRQIVQDASLNNHRVSDFILGVVNSQAFQTKRRETVAAVASESQ